MIEEIGIICGIEQDDTQQVVLVETQIKSTCGSCDAQSTCGTSTIAKVFANKREVLRFRLNDLVEIGQKVSLGIPENNLLKASVMVYCLPLLALVVSAVLGGTILPVVGLSAEVWVILLSAFSAYSTFKLVQRHMNTSNQEHFHPCIVKIFPLESNKIEVKQV